MTPKKDLKFSAKQPQKTQKMQEGGGGGKAKKKKWFRGNVMLFNEATYKKFIEEVPHHPSVISERMKVRGSLAKRALAQSRDQDLILQVVQHHSQIIYTKVIKGDDA